MSIPTSLLTRIESHSCFSGCWGGDTEAAVCVDPNHALEPTLVITCRDCLTRLGVLRRLLTPPRTVHQLADEITAHVRTQRGFALSVSGYHTQGPGFWLGAVYYATASVFLLEGSRSRHLGSDLDLLLLAFQHGVLRPLDPRMTDPRAYAGQTVYVDFSRPLGPIRVPADLLASPQVSTTARPGFHRVTLAEFRPTNIPAVAVPTPNRLNGVPTPTATVPTATVPTATVPTATVPTATVPTATVPTATVPTATVPTSTVPTSTVPTSTVPAANGVVARPAAASTAKSANSAPTAAPPLKLGDICPKCKAVVKERPLLNRTYVGCLC